ncbi:MAG TPA: DUF885 domain-containing protein, partial [Pseudonocardia sp.]|nr:DUF885 domain-containing protein [Pseudonocardia sp.]
YRELTRMHTTSELGPEELHRTGLELLEQLAREYAVIGAEAFGSPDAGTVQQRMRNDPSLRWGSAEEMLAAARGAVSRAEAVAPAWFDRLPAGACAVEPAPGADGPSAYYLPPALDGSRPGTYLLNVGTPGQRMRYLAEVTAFHEAVPGHHLQLSRAQGLDGLLPLRRLAWINSYIEGWGLYAERLADRMGLYSGPLARLGMLAMDSLRAARLVVDTGLHAFGWSRHRAVDHLLAATVLTPTEAEAEVDRYVELPAQALSYMVGRLEIDRVRARAERELGQDFDVRRFHDVVLGQGALPMTVLDAVVAEWSGAVRDGSARAS